MICSQSEDVLDWEFHEKAALVGRNNFFLFGWETGFESHPVYCAYIKKQLKEALSTTGAWRKRQRDLLRAKTRETW